MGVLEVVLLRLPMLGCRNSIGSGAVRSISWIHKEKKFVTLDSLWGRQHNGFPRAETSVADNHRSAVQGKRRFGYLYLWRIMCLHLSSGMGGQFLVKKK